MAYRFNPFTGTLDIILDPASVGDITAVGDVASGEAFNGTQGTVLTFFDAGGNATFEYNGTNFIASVPIQIGSSITIDGTTNPGTITESNGSISFVDENLTTTGVMQASRYEVDGAGTYIDVDGSNNITFTDAVSGTVTLATLVADVGFPDPMTTRGDVIIRNPANATTRLGIGANGTVLTSDGTDISWQAATTGDITSVGDVAGGAAFDGTQGTTLTFFNAGGNATIDYDGTDITSSVDITVPNEAYGAGWNGSLETPTKDAVYDEMETKLDDPMTTRGDIIIRDATNTTARLPIGANTFILTSDGTDVSWAAGGGGGGNTLDAAYDEGGAGVGRTIDADSGAVEITVSNTDNNGVLTLNQNDTTNNPVTLSIANTGSGNDITATNWNITQPGVATFVSLNLTANSNQIVLDSDDGSGFTTTLTDSATAARVLTLPDATDTLMGKATTDTMTNKTFDANGAGNSLSNVDVVDLADGTDGELITWDATGAPATVAVGTATHVLTSNGAGAAPTFQAIPASGGNTLDEAYDEGGAGVGRSIDADSGAVAITVSDTDNNSALEITQNDTTNNPAGMVVTNAGTGDGITVTQTGNGRAIDVTASNTTEDVVGINSTTLTTGRILDIVDNSADNSTRHAISVIIDNVAANNATAYRTRVDSDGRGMFIQHSGNGISLEVDSNVTTANTVVINADPTTTGNVIDVSADSLTTGSIMSLVSDSADNSARNLVEIINENAAADTAIPLYLRNDGDEGAIQLVDGNESDGYVLTSDANGIGTWQAAGGGASAVTKDINQVAHGFSVGDVLRLSGASTYTEAQADSSANAEAVGIVSAVAGVDDFTITTSGYMTGLAGLTANTVYFLSEATAGLLTATEPSTVGDISKPMLVSDTTTSGYVLVMRGLIVNTTTPGASAVGSIFTQFAGDGSDGDLLTTANEALIADYGGSANTPFVKQYDDFTVDTGDTLTVDTGWMFIGVAGTCTIDGTISADAYGEAHSTGAGKDGASAEGVKLDLASATGQNNTRIPETTVSPYVNQFPINGCLSGAAGGGGKGHGGVEEGGAGGGAGGYGGWGGNDTQTSSTAGGDALATPSSKILAITCGAAGDNVTHTDVPSVLAFMAKHRGAGGGGGGDSGKNGGAGGGVIYIECDTLDLSGTLSADGENGTAGNPSSNQGGGGGGGGGIIIVRYLNTTGSGNNPTAVTVTGGTGGASGGLASNTAGGDGAAGFKEIVNG